MARTSKRRSSRKPVGNARKGTLSYKHVRARELKGTHPVFGKRFNGRIEVDRGAGVIEFPKPEQFKRIASQEGIPSETVDKAFGHMRGMGKTKKRRTSRKKRRTSRKVRRNARRKRVIRHGYLHTDQTTSGEKVSFTAREYFVEPEDVKRRGYTVGVEVDIAGQARVMNARDAMRQVYPWFSKEDFLKAFGHVLRKKAVARTSAKRIPTVFGPRSMRLGYWTGMDIDSSGRPVHAPGSYVVAGAQPGQLVLFHKPSKSVVWQAFADPEYDGYYSGEPAVIRIIAAGTSRMKGFREGKGNVGFGKALRMAQDRDIPPIAFLDAFGFMLEPDSRRELYREFMRAKPKKKK